MAGDKAKRGKPNCSRINVNEDYKKAYWKYELGVSGQQARRRSVQSPPDGHGREEVPQRQRLSTLSRRQAQAAAR